MYSTIDILERKYKILGHWSKMLITYVSIGGPTLNLRKTLESLDINKKFYMLIIFVHRKGRICLPLLILYKLFIQINIWTQIRLLEDVLS